MNFDRIKYYYNAGLWNAPMVKTAVKKGIITPAQYTEITGLDYTGASNASIIEEKAAAYDILTGGLN